jgi:short-subunit dehydrogenase
VADLSRPDFIETIRQQTRDIEVSLLVSNAAYPPVGLFFEQSLEDKLRMIDVNVRAPLILVQEFGAKMLARKRGGIIMVASASALQGVAYIASYAATKAYNLILAESLWDELREHGVDVLGFMPGATRTTGFVLSKPNTAHTVATIMETKPTVTEALNALGKAPSRIPGRRNRCTLLLAQKILPRKQMIKLVGSNMRQWYGKQ